MSRGPTFSFNRGDLPELSNVLCLVTLVGVSGAAAAPLRVRVECLRDGGGGEGVRRRESLEDDLGSGAAPLLEVNLEFDSEGVE